jgi:hypothetical protein
MARGCSGHFWRRLSRGDHDRGVELVRYIGKRGVDQHTWRNRSDAGPDNRQDVVSKIRE